MVDSRRRPVFTSSLYYRDPRTMLGWLELAFGFETFMVISDDSGAVVHAEMRHGDGVIMVGGEWGDWAKSPVSAGGANTQNIHVHLTDGLEAHCERARAAGAVIAMEPEDQFYGDRVYRAVDPEGHGWTFAGLKIEGWIDIPS